MEPRFNYAKASPGAFQAMLAFSKYVHECGLPESILNLVFLRASQINGCAWCLDMHWKDLRASGETEQRLYSLDAWRESPFYSDRERAALKWTEAVTVLGDGHVTDQVYEEVRPFFQRQGIIGPDSLRSGHQWLEPSEYFSTQRSRRLSTGQTISC